MKKLIILFLSLLSLNLLQAEDLKTITVEGDLNKDGIKDRVVVDFAYTAEDNFAIYFGDANGNFNLFRSYATSLYSYDNTNITINDKGVLRIQKGATGDCEVFLFRYQDGDFQMIGSKIDRHENEHYDISHNYLTGKMIRTEGEGKAKKSETIDMPPMPKLKFGWFPLDFESLEYLFQDYELDENGSDELKEYKTVTGIYQLMQWNGIMFSSFFTYHELEGSSKEGWSTYNEIMKPACYNYASTLEMTKQKDGSYLIHLIDESQDRSYESVFYNDDESDDEDFEIPPTSITEQDWLFKDGKFTLIRETTREE